MWPGKNRLSRKALTGSAARLLGSGLDMSTVRGHCGVGLEAELGEGRNGLAIFVVGVVGQPP